MAIKLGSARICNTCFCCRGLMVAPRLMSGRNRKIFKRSDKLNLCELPVFLTVD